MKLAFACLAIMAVCVASAPAATVQLDIDYAGSFDGAFNPIGSPLDTGTAVPGAYHQFDVLMTMNGAVAGEDLGVLIFDVDLGAGFTPSDVGWTPATIQWDPPGPPGPTAIFSESSDAGNDLKAITIIAASGTNYGGVHTVRPGINGAPTNIGSIFVNWDGTKPSDAVIAANPNISDPYASVIGTTLNVGTAANLAFGPAYTIAGDPTGEAPDVGPLNAGLIPRNATIGLGPLPILNVPDPAAVTWSLTSFSGSGEPSDSPASVDPVTGLFSWDANGSTSVGPYTAVIRATNATGFDEAELTFTTFVPEPASFGLFGIAMVAGLGIVRRRNG
jgi:hypothetical protein